MAFQPDPKDGPRIKDPALLRELHGRWDWCPLCMYEWADGMGALSLHHVLPKGSPYFGDDLEGNLVMLCGSGTTGHHGLIEAADEAACKLLGMYLVRRRRDVLGYVHAKLGIVAGDEWLRRHLQVVWSA